MKQLFSTYATFQHTHKSLLCPAAVKDSCYAVHSALVLQNEVPLKLCYGIFFIVFIGYTYCFCRKIFRNTKYSLFQNITKKGTFE